MQDSVPRAYYADCAAIVLCMAVTCAVLGLVLHEALPLAQEPRTKAILTVAAAAVAIFAVAALLAALVHLKRNRTALYAEDLVHQKREGRESPHV